MIDVCAIRCCGKNGGIGIPAPATHLGQGNTPDGRPGPQAQSTWPLWEAQFVVIAPRTGPLPSIGDPGGFGTVGVRPARLCSGAALATRSRCDGPARALRDAEKAKHPRGAAALRQRCAETSPPTRARCGQDRAPPTAWPGQRGRSGQQASSAVVRRAAVDDR
jgi:hypothetical protein